MTFQHARRADSCFVFYSTQMRCTDVGRQRQGPALPYVCKHGQPGPRVSGRSGMGYTGASGDSMSTMWMGLHAPPRQHRRATSGSMKPRKPNPLDDLDLIRCLSGSWCDLSRQEYEGVHVCRSAGVHRDCHPPSPLPHDVFPILGGGMLLPTKTVHLASHQTQLRF